jgi:uncharacterized OB-fold protein
MTTSARVWREKPHRYRLEGTRCKKCGRTWVPSRAVCPCGGHGLSPVTLPEEGKIVTWTVVHTGHPEFGDGTPYALAVVEFGKGARLLMQLADFRREDLKIGRKVRVEFRKIQAAGESGVLCYGYKAVACSE